MLHVALLGVGGLSQYKVLTDMTEGPSFFVQGHV